MFYLRGSLFKRRQSTLNKDLTSLKRNLSRNTGLQLGEFLENWSEEFNDRSIASVANCNRLNNLINIVPIFITESKNNVFVTGILSL